MRMIENPFRKLTFKDIEVDSEELQVRHDLRLADKVVVGRIVLPVRKSVIGRTYILLCINLVIILHVRKFAIDVVV